MQIIDVVYRSLGALPETGSAHTLEINLRSRARSLCHARATLGITSRGYRGEGGKGAEGRRQGEGNNTN